MSARPRARQKTQDGSTSRSAHFLPSLFSPIDGASVAVFRIAFGLVILWEVWRYFSYGWIAAFYIEPEFLFTYPGFGWVRPWPGDGMLWHFAGLGVLGAMIAAGLFYRMAMALFFVGFGYVFLLDQARYLNHFYLVALVAFLMVFVPAARNYSLDAWRKGRRGPVPIPRWTLVLLVLQFEIMLIFAGLVKIEADWLMGEPLGVWLSGSAGLPIIGPWLLEPAVVTMAAWSAIVLHVLGAPLLLFKATRLPVFVAYCLFHMANALFWEIGIFPWFTIAGTTLFFAPSWPRDLLARLRRRVPQRLPTAGLTFPQAVSPAARIAVASFPSVWCLVQIALPLRHLLYPGHVSWSEEGHQFSWQMMLRAKEGVALFSVRDPATGRTWQVEPLDYLTGRQARYMAGRPEMMRLFAHYIDTVWEREFQTADVEVRAFTAVSLNGRPSMPLVDPLRDLTAIGYSLRPADWILPFDARMPPADERWRDDFYDRLEALIGEAREASVEIGGAVPSNAPEVALD